jgi:hypothetical protein
VTFIDPTGDLSETPLLTAQSELLGLAAPGEFVFTVDLIGYRGAHIVYSADGQKISEVERDRDQREFVWNRATRRLYSSEIWNPYDIYWEEVGDDGSIGDEFEPPYYIDYEARLPIRVSPEGSTVVLGSGWVLWGDSLEESHDLDTEILDATWIDDSLFTLRDSGLYSEIQELDQEFVLQDSILVAGEPVRIFGLESQLLILYLNRNGVPSFWLRDPHAPPDIDGDGILDHLDNCPETANPEQLDTDQDGIGDACNDEIDQDGDEWADAIDACPAIVNPDQTDTDGDGIGDLCNDGDDRDGDEWADDLDNCPDVVNPGQEDQDRDGTGDACDTCPAATDEGALFIAAAAHTEGLQGSSWRTDLTVRNDGFSAADIYMRFLPRGGNPNAACVHAGQIPAGQAVQFEDVVASVFGAEGAGGIAIYSTGKLLATSRTYTTSEAGTFGLGVPARSQNSGLGFWRDGTLLQLQQNARYRTNVGFLNLSPWVTTVRVRYYRQDASMLLYVDYELQPMESHQANKPLRGLGQIENAFAMISVPSGGPVLCYATVVDNISNDPTYVEPQ